MTDRNECTEGSFADVEAQIDGSMDDQAAPVDAAARMEAIGRSGLTISVCCGPSGREPFRWSVTVLAPDGREFEQPFAAHDFDHAVAIAEKEIAARGWGRSK
jgi:hypothetical protein